MLFVILYAMLQFVWSSLFELDYVSYKVMTDSMKTYKN